MGQPQDIPTEHLLRELAPQVLGTVVRKFPDFAAAEDAVQESLLAAATQWPEEGMPDNPRAWLIQVAFRKMADLVRSEAARRRRETEMAFAVEQAEPFRGELLPEEEDGLLLLFMCCHPALTDASAIALTLRAVGGLTTAEIAHAFLVPEATMAQRISRAKQTIRSCGARFALPSPAERTERLRAVLHVLYLIFNEGYTSSAGPTLRRDDLAAEAIRLVRLVHERRPGDPEAASLLALLLLTDARRTARTGPAGELIPLAEQDRMLWNQSQIEEGIRLLSAALPAAPAGPYQLLAAIAALHDEALRPEETDWVQILALYEMLRGIAPNPMVDLSHAIAEAMVHGPARGLELLDAFSDQSRLQHQHRVDATRAHLLELSGDNRAAVLYYRLAAGKTANLAERNYLIAKAARLEEQGRAGQPPL